MSGLTNPTSADHLAAQEGSFTIQHQNNWSIEIPLDGADKDVVIAALDTFSIPSTSNETIEVNYQNEKRKLAGSVTVETPNLVLKDFVDQDTLGAILRWRKKVYDPTTGKVGLAKDYKKTCYVILHASDGTSVRTCKLTGVYPSTDPAVGLDMSSSDKVTLEVPLEVDKVVWELQNL